MGAQRRIDSWEYNKCPKCGTLNDEEDVFCFHCGGKLEKTTEKTATTRPPLLKEISLPKPPPAEAELEQKYEKIVRHACIPEEAYLGFGIIILGVPLLLFAVMFRQFMYTWLGAQSVVTAKWTAIGLGLLSVIFFGVGCFYMIIRGKGGPFVRIDKNTLLGASTGLFSSLIFVAIAVLGKLNTGSLIVRVVSYGLPITSFCIFCFVSYMVSGCIGTYIGVVRKVGGRVVSASEGFKVGLIILIVGVPLTLISERIIVYLQWGIQLREVSWYYFFDDVTYRSIGSLIEYCGALIGAMGATLFSKGNKRTLGARNNKGIGDNA